MEDKGKILRKEEEKQTEKRKRDCEERGRKIRKTEKRKTLRKEEEKRKRGCEERWRKGRF